MKIDFIDSWYHGKAHVKEPDRGRDELLVPDLNQDAVAEVVSAGATASDNNTIASECEMVSTMYKLPNSPQEGR